MDPEFSIKDYLVTKSFKMSDAYSVEISDREPSWQMESDTNLSKYFTPQDITAYGIKTSVDDASYKQRLFTFKNCTGFTAPTYKPAEHELKYCNTTRVIYVPNKDKPNPFQIKFHETERQYAMKFLKYCLAKNFYDEDVDKFSQSYNPYRYIDEIRVHVWDNNLHKRVLTHIFRSCRLVDYDYAYKLDYESAGFIQPSASFSFLKYSIDPNPEN